MESAREYLPFSHLDSINLSQTCCSGHFPADSVDLPCPLSHTDVRVEPRQSLTGSTRSMPTSITWQSSTRSSSTRGHSLSTQSSLRRYSDLSSSDISGFLPNLRTGDSFMDPELLGLVEDEVELEDDLPPFSSSMVETHSTELVPVRSVSPLESTNNCAKTEGTAESFLNAASLTRCLLEQGGGFTTGVSDNAPQAAELPPAVLGATHPTVMNVPLLDSIIDHWTTQVFKEAVMLAEDRDREFRGFANALSCSLVHGAIRIVEWGDQYGKIVLRQAMAQANQQLLSISSHLGRNEGFFFNGRERRRRYHSVLFSPYPIMHRRSAEDDLPTLNASKRKPHCYGRHSRKPFSPLCVRPLVTSIRVFPQVKQNKFHDSAVKPDASETSTLKPNAVGGFSSFDPQSHHQAEVEVSDRLNRFAESLASGCCIGAMHAIQSRWLRAKGLDPDRVRPSGLVTTGWNKDTVNPTADPQLKVLTQWIAAAVASACATMKNYGPFIETSNNQASVSFASEESPSPWEYHISPIVVCTNNDPRLEQLGAVVKLVYSTDCSAGTLLSLLCDYAAYRRGSMNVPFQSEPSLFDYLLQRLHTSVGLSVSS
ncbi:hypothetical protein AHF37_02652 [Paragonimus kellicotti]|nr:hypothetical protein AHF37_02652 [Paragonimus kellicotti]